MRRPLYWLIGLFALLVFLLLLMPPSAERQPPLTVYSAEPSGGKALRLWLEEFGYRVTTIEGGRYAVPSDVRTVLLLDPTEPLESSAQVTLEQWVRGGGRLVVASDSPLVWSLLRRFRIGADFSPKDIEAAVPAAAGRLDPEIGTVPVQTNVTLTLSQATDAVPLLVAPPAPDDDPARPAIVAARVPVDRGEVIVLTDPALLSNRALRDETNARLALSLIGPAAGGGLAFDEVHHGIGTVRERSIYDLLLEQAWGRTAMLAAGVLLLFLLLRGRRFGRAVPVFVDRGRSLGELVTSQAALYRVGGKRAFAAEHLSRQLRQDLAQEVGLPASASDQEIADRAQSLGRDPTRALRVLATTAHARSDRELLALAREGARARTELGRSGPQRASQRLAPTRTIVGGQG